MKKYILGAVLSFGILVSPAFTHATGLTSDQIQSILGLLSSLGVDQSTIDNVRTALGGGGQTTGGTSFCHNFNTGLTVGSSGADVAALREAFSRSGIAPSITNDTSVFDEDTAAEVGQFQAKYGIRQTGYVGPLTRAKLNSLYGCNGQSTSVSNSNPNTANGLCPAGQTWSGPTDSGECVSVTTTTVTPVTLTAITPSSGPVGTNIRLDGCGSDSSSGFTLVYAGPKSGTAVIPVETLGAASGCGYMTVTVPTDFPAGAYTLQVKNNQTGAMSTNSEAFTVTVAGATATQTTANTSTIAASACTTSFSPNSIKIGDFTTWNFAAGAGDTTFQYSCSSGFTRADGTMPLSYGPLPLSGSWSIKVTGPLDCTLTSWNPNVTGSGSTCRAILKLADVGTTGGTTGGTAGGTTSSAACTTSFSPNPVKTGDITTWNFQSGAGDTTFQYSCSNLFTKEDGTPMLSYGSLPLGSGSWRIKSPGPLDCTLDSYNPNVIGSGSQCRVILKTTY